MSYCSLGLFFFIFVLLLSATHSLAEKKENVPAQMLSKSTQNTAQQIPIDPKSDKYIGLTHTALDQNNIISLSRDGLWALGFESKAVGDEGASESKYFLLSLLNGAKRDFYTSQTWTDGGARYGQNIGTSELSSTLANLKAEMKELNFNSTDVQNLQSSVKPVSFKNFIATLESEGVLTIMQWLPTNPELKKIAQKRPVFNLYLKMAGSSIFMGSYDQIPKVIESKAGYLLVLSEPFKVFQKKNKTLKWIPPPSSIDQCNQLNASFCLSAMNLNTTQYEDLHLQANNPEKKQLFVLAKHFQRQCKVGNDKDCLKFYKIVNRDFLFLNDLNFLEQEYSLRRKLCSTESFCTKIPDTETVTFNKKVCLKGSYTNCGIAVNDILMTSGLKSATDFFTKQIRPMLLKKITTDPQAVRAYYEGLTQEFVYGAADKYRFKDIPIPASDNETPKFFLTEQHLWADWECNSRKLKSSECIKKLSWKVALTDHSRCDPMFSSDERNYLNFLHSCAEAVFFMQLLDEDLIYAKKFSFRIKELCHKRTNLKYECEKIEIERPKDLKRFGININQSSFKKLLLGPPPKDTAH